MDRYPFSVVSGEGTAHRETGGGGRVDLDALVVACRSRDPGTLAELCSLLRGQLWREIRISSPLWLDPEDVFGDVIVDLLECLAHPGADACAPLEHWVGLVEAARRAIGRVVRQKKREQYRTCPFDGTFDETIEGRRPRAGLAGLEIQEVVAHIRSRLNPEEDLLFRLEYEECLRLAEIGEILHHSAHQLACRRHRLRRKLRRLGGQILRIAGG